MFKKGFVSYGKYGGETIAAGKEVKKFSLKYRSDAGDKYLNNVTAWHDGIEGGAWDAIADGNYIGLEYSTNEVERDGRTFENVTAKAIWLRADGYTGGSSQPQLAPGLYDSDIPF